MTLQPFNFEEFLLTNGEKTLVEFVKNDGICETPKAITENCWTYLEQYFVMGGMPAAVALWVDTGDLGTVIRRQLDILATYKNDFYKYAPKNIVPKLQYLWNNRPSLLSKENKKFVHTLLVRAYTKNHPPK